MAVLDSASASHSDATVGSSTRGFEAAAPDSNSGKDSDHRSINHSRGVLDFNLQQKSTMLHSASSYDQSSQMKVHQDFHGGCRPSQAGGQVGVDDATDQRGTANMRKNGEAAGERGYQPNMRDLEELMSNLNPMAEEFVPPSLASHMPYAILCPTDFAFPNGDGRWVQRKNSFGQGKRRINNRTNMAQREEVIRRTVYVSDIDHQATEEHLAALFSSCGQIVDCRVCGDPNSVLRFAFIEFTDEEGAQAALALSGTIFGYYPLRVLPSKTAIAPVNPTFLPRSEDEREMCARTIYCTNIDKKVTQADLRHFFESICGEVYRLRLLGDSHHSTRIAFVEFIMAESAIVALSCSGAVLGSLPIRVSPSKTPVRPRVPRPRSTDETKQV